MEALYKIVLSVLFLTPASISWKANYTEYKVQPLWRILGRIIGLQFA